MFIMDIITFLKCDHVSAESQTQSELSRQVSNPSELLPHDQPNRFLPPRVSQTVASTQLPITNANTVVEYEFAIEPVVKEESWEIQWDQLMLGRTILGEGNFGEVCEGVLWRNGKAVKVAVKSLKGWYNCIRPARLGTAKFGRLNFCGRDLI